MGIDSLTGRQLAVYVAVAQNLSFRAASEELHIAQSAVSVTIRDVERKLGAKLFERDTRNVFLTPAGQRLLELALALMDYQRAAARDFDSFLRGEAGDLTVSALPSVAAAILPDIVSRFTRDHPAVQVHLHDRFADEVVEDLKSGLADIGVTSRSSVPSDGFETHHLVDNPLVAVLPAGHVLCAGEKVTWKELSSERLVSARHGSIQPLVDRAFASIGTQVTPQAEAGSIQSIAGLVAAGLGVAVLPLQSVPLIAFSQVETRPLVHPSMTQTLVIAWRHTRRPGPTVARFIKRVYEGVERAEASTLP